MVYITCASLMWVLSLAVMKSDLVYLPEVSENELMKINRRIIMAYVNRDSCNLAPSFPDVVHNTQQTHNTFQSVSVSVYARSVNIDYSVFWSLHSIKVFKIECKFKRQIDRGTGFWTISASHATLHFRLWISIKSKLML